MALIMLNVRDEKSCIIFISKIGIKIVESMLKVC